MGPGSPSTLFFTSLTLIAFAGNSILCRLALAQHLIDAASFTSIRLFSGAAALLVILLLRDRGRIRPRIRIVTGIALVAYAAPFSFAYLSIPAGTGALILFGAVQVTMIGWDILRGHRLPWQEWCGLALALLGLVGLTLPGAVDPLGAILMAAAGIAWGYYSIYGRGTEDPVQSTAWNFALGVLLVLPFPFIVREQLRWTPEGATYAILSGAVTSGLGYALWYRALRGLTATQAGIVQLLVPVLAAVGGVLLLGETVTVRLVVAGILIFSGVGLAVVVRTKSLEDMKRRRDDGG
jgi:drug/metabolite transporter (DMT)-like permease